MKPAHLNTTGQGMLAYHAPTGQLWPQRALAQGLHEFKGQLQASDLPRLKAEVQPQSNFSVQWRLTLASHPRAPIRLQISLETELQIPCLSCELALSQPITSELNLLLCASEAQADSLEAEGIESQEAVEVLYVPLPVDVKVLIEDEILLNLPSSPYHAACRQSVPHHSDEDAIAPPGTNKADKVAIKAGVQMAIKAGNQSPGRAASKPVIGGSLTHRPFANLGQQLAQQKAVPQEVLREIQASKKINKKIKPE